jgi:7-cyano-7-deazaguanine tRNA-ribosyltransferase
MTEAKIINSVLGDTMDARMAAIRALENEHFIFSVWPFYSSPKKKERLATSGIHEYVKHVGPLMLDSGGFQMVRRAVDLSADDTLDIYARSRLNADDLAISLDYCPRPDDPPATRIAKIQRTNENFRHMNEQDGHVLHVVHGWTRKELELSMTAVTGPTSVGSYFAMLAKPANFTMLTMNIGLDEMLKATNSCIKNLVMSHLLQFIDILRMRHLDELKVHVLGASSSHSSHLLWYAGMDQMDSASWRVKAAYGKISLLGVSEIGISTRDSTFGRSVKWNDARDQLLLDCTCPVCDGLSVAERKTNLGVSFQLRALHNAHVFLQERDLARELLGTRKYLPYLQERFRKSPFWNRFLKKVNEGRHQKRLDAFLKAE